MSVMKDLRMGAITLIFLRNSLVKCEWRNQNAFYTIFA